MPIYLYECTTCEKSFEIEQRITEDKLTVCTCGNNGKVKRLIQPTAIMFKGSGFYVNDSQTTVNKSSSGESSKESPSTESTPADHPTPPASTPPSTSTSES